MIAKCVKIASFIILFVGSLSAQQQVNLTGMIRDAKTSEPLPDVAVTVSGTAKGVTTAKDGSFVLEVSPNDELIITCLGYKSVREKPDGRTSLQILLEEDSFLFDDVVVLGYGVESRKADLSVAVANMSIDENIKSRSGGMFASLQGQIAGVGITNDGGDPLRSPSIIIRGMGNRNNEAPLFVVDGVPGAPFNQEDVVSITVLKDAASAAIYGTNVGSGGVILIITKKAAEGKTAITARASFGIQQAWRKPKVLNAEEYVAVRTHAYEADGRAVAGALDPNVYPYGQVTRTDWVDEIFRTGQVQRYAVTLTGGSDVLKAYASAEYGSVQGTLLNTRSENFGSKLNVDFKINNYASLSQKLNFNYSNGQGGVNASSHTGVTAAAMFMPPSATIYDMDENGNYVLDNNGNKVFGGTVPSWASALGVAGAYGEIQNPVATLMRLNQNRPNQRIFSTTSLIINPVKGLNLKSEFSIGSSNNRYEDFSVRILEIGKTDNNNARSLSYSRAGNRLWENTASYDRMFGRHSVNAMAGHSMSYSKYNSLDVTVYNFPNEDTYSQHLINGTDWNRRKPEEGKAEESLISIFARGAYSFADRYFVTASVRRDASSKLYTDNNAGIFPAVSGAWKLSSENFMSSAKNIVSLLKLRAGWGQIGNVSGVQNYSYASNFSQMGDAIALGDNHQNPIRGLGLTTIVNRNLRWETSEQTDIGIDVELLKGRISLSADYFVKNTKDMVDEIPMASVAGVSVQPLGNVGLVQNKGWEFTAEYRERFGKNMQLHLSANLALLKSEVKDLGEEFLAHDATIRAMQPLRSTVGQPWYSYYVIETDGIFQNQNEIDAHTHTDESGNSRKIQPNARPGDLKFKDKNNDGLINDADRNYAGSYLPKFTYGFNAGMTYKNFDLNILLQGVAGNKIFNGVKVMTYSAGQGWNMSKDVLDSWGYKNNTNTDIPLVTVEDRNGNFSTVSDFFLENGSYLRVKNITMGYTFPKFFNSSVRLYCSADNLLTFTGYSGMDPEIQVDRRGLDGGTYPVARSFSIGVNLTF